MTPLHLFTAGGRRLRPLMDGGADLTWPKTAVSAAQ